MCLKMLARNVYGVGAKERDLKELISKNKPDIVILSELKATSLNGLRNTWPGAKIELIPSLGIGVRYAPRAGIAILARENLEYTVRFVRDDVGDGTNGVIQSLTLDLEGRKIVTGAYIFPNISGGKMEEVVRTIIRDGMGQDILAGDLNPRHARWDMKSNERGKDLQRCTEGKRFDRKAPPHPTDRPTGRSGPSNLT